MKRFPFDRALPRSVKKDLTAVMKDSVRGAGREHEYRRHLLKYYSLPLLQILRDSPEYASTNFQVCGDWKLFSSPFLWLLGPNSDVYLFWLS